MRDDRIYDPRKSPLRNFLENLLAFAVLAALMIWGLRLLFKAGELLISLPFWQAATVFVGVTAVLAALFVNAEHASRADEDDEDDRRRPRP